MAKRRSRGRSTPVTISVGVAWYDAIQWAKLKQIAVDADELNDSYEEWKQSAMTLERDLRRKGIEIQRVHVNIDVLIAWCQSHNRPVDGPSRSAYAAEMASRGASE